MSDDFANLIGKALNTPPTGTITLKPGERTEIKNMGGRVFKPIRIILNNQDIKASAFELIVETQSISDKFHTQLDVNSKFEWIGVFLRIKVPIITGLHETLFVTLNTPIGLKGSIESAVFEYTYGTPY